MTTSYTVVDAQGNPLVTGRGEVPRRDEVISFVVHDETTSPNITRPARTLIVTQVTWHSVLWDRGDYRGISGCTAVVHVKEENPPKSKKRKQKLVLP